jgi:hypothetical protein
MSDRTTLHRRSNVWPSPAFVLGLALGTTKGFGLRPRPARPAARPEKRHTAIRSDI